MKFGAPQAYGRTHGASDAEIQLYERIRTLRSGRMRLASSGSGSRRVGLQLPRALRGLRRRVHLALARASPAPADLGCRANRRGDRRRYVSWIQCVDPVVHLARRSLVDVVGAFRDGQEFGGHTVTRLAATRYTYLAESGADQQARLDDLVDNWRIHQQLQDSSFRGNSLGVVGLVVQGEEPNRAELEERLLIGSEVHIRAKIEKYRGARTRLPQHEHELRSAAGSDHRLPRRTWIDHRHLLDDRGARRPPRTSTRKHCGCLTER